MDGVKENRAGPSQVSSVGRASTCKLKSPEFDSEQGHMPGLWATSPVGGMQEVDNQWCSPVIDISLSPFPFYSEINKNFFKIKKDT